MAHHVRYFWQALPPRLTPTLPFDIDGLHNDYSLDPAGTKHRDSEGRLWRIRAVFRQMGGQAPTAESL